MVAAVAPLGHRRTAKITRPDDQGVVKHAALFQVGDQRHAGAVDLLEPFRATPLFHAAVMVPVLVVELDEPHPAASASRRASRQFEANEPSPRLAVVEIKRLPRLSPAQVHQLGDAGLHPGTPSRTGATRVAISGSWAKAPRGSCRLSAPH